LGLGNFYYDKKRVHRVGPKVGVQGGDPTGTGEGRIITIKISKNFFFLK